MAWHPPSEFNNNRVNPGDSVCEALAKVFQQVNLVADNEAFKWNEDGTLSAAYIARLCATGCAGGGDTATSTPDPEGSTSIYMASRFLSGGVNRGRLFFIDSSDFSYSTVNGDMQQVIVGMAISPVTGIAWVVYQDMVADSSPFPIRLGTVNLATGIITFIAVINSGGSDWSDLLTYDRFSLEVMPSGTLLLSYWEISGGTNSRLYTVNLITGELTQLGAASTNVVMSDTAATFIVYSIAYDSGGTLRALGFNISTNSYITATINTTPNPAFGNSLVATQECQLSSVGSVPVVDQTIYQGIVNKSDDRLIWVRATADILKVADGSGCAVPAVLKLTGTPSMSNVMAVAGVPS